MAYNFGKRKASILLILALVFMAATCPPKPPTPKIWITVCNNFPDTPPAEARIANEFCPATHPAQYIDKDGQRPTEICTTHTKPEPPIPQCDVPWPDKRWFGPWDGALLGYYCSKELDGEFTKDRLTAYADALAEDGIPLTRGFSHFYDEIPGIWESWKPVDQEYRDILQFRIKLMADRKITSIISLEPYGAGLAPDADIDWIIDSAKPFLPWVIFETANENGNTSLSAKLISQLKGHGIPSENILIYFEDSGAFADLLVNTLEGKGLASLHGVGSMETIDAPWPNGWSTSPGTLKLMIYGLTGSNDGDDYAKEAKGLLWPWLPNGPGRRSTAGQSHDITFWYLTNGGRGWEFLSASGFQQHGPGQQRPDLLGAVELGKEERRAMRRAYGETIH